MSLRLLLRLPATMTTTTETGSVLMESDTLLKKALPFVWPTSERQCYEAEGKLLSLANVDISRKLVEIRPGVNLNTLEMGEHYSEPRKAHLNKTLVIMPGFGAAVGLFYRNFEGNLEVSFLFFLFCLFVCLFVCSPCSSVSSVSSVSSASSGSSGSSGSPGSPLTVKSDPLFSCFFLCFFEAFAGVPGLKTFAVDWLGTGRSTRVPFNIRPGKPGSVQAAEDFFIDSLEEWREKQGIDKMILFGHSLGGYLSACYALKYPDRVEHLMLVSPAGVPASPAISENEMQEFKKRRPFVYRTVGFFWERSFTPQGLIRFVGPWGPKLVRAYTDRRFPYLEDEEASIFRDYAYHFNARKASAEAGLHCVLDVGAWARNPLIDRVHEIRSPTTFLYGSHDWMNPNAGKAAAARMTVPASVKVIPRADHHLYLDNPEAFNRAVVEVIRDTQRQSSI